MRRGERREARVGLAVGSAALVLVMTCLVGGLNPAQATRREDAREGESAGSAEPDQRSAADEGERDGTDPSTQGEGVASPDAGDSPDTQGPAAPDGSATDVTPGVSVQEGDVQQVASRLLASYRDAGDCVLASSGYLDLFGSVWGCVVRGDGWVDICIVSEAGEGSASEVRVMRLTEDEVTESLDGVSDGG